MQDNAIGVKPCNNQGKVRSGQKAGPKRNTFTFEPPKPLRSMIENEMKRFHRPGTSSRGALKKVICLCLIETLGPKYPKLAERYNVLREEEAI